MTDDDVLHGQLAARLMQQHTGEPVDLAAEPGYIRTYWFAQADALLPVVRAYAAKQLRDAADDLTTGDPELTAPVKRYLRALADALDPQDGQP